MLFGTLQKIGGSDEEQCLSSEEGGSLVEVAVAMPLFVLLLVGAIDFGRAYFLSVQVASAAEAGANYGMQNFTDTAGMQAAAKLNAANAPSLSVTATFGCECHDGTSVTISCTTTPNCAQNVLNYSEVSATAIYTPLIPYPGIPSTLTLSSKTHIRSSQ